MIKRRVNLIDVFLSVAVVFILTAVPITRALINLRDNPCTNVPLLSALNLVSKCSDKIRCQNDNECKWDYELDGRICKYYAYNHVTERCKDDTEIFRRELGTENAIRNGWKTEWDVCVDLMKVFGTYGGDRYYRALSDCEDQSEWPKDAICRKTEFDIATKGPGFCVLEYSE